SASVVPPSASAARAVVSSPADAGARGSGAFAAEGEDAEAVASPPARSGSCWAGVVTAGAGAAAGGSLAAWARRRSSGVFVHRQWRSETPAPVIPPVRTSVKTPEASTMLTTIDARRGPLESRRLATAQATNARLKTGIPKM